MSNEPETRIRTNRLNIEWLYAGQCFNALREEKKLPPIPNYQTYIKKPGEPEKLVSSQPIKPKMVRYKGWQVFS